MCRFSMIFLDSSDLEVTYRLASANIPMTPTFCRVGMLSFQTMGRGSTSTAQFKTVLMTARPTKEETGSIHEPDI